MKSVNLSAGQAIQNLIPNSQLRSITINSFYFILSIFVSKGTVFGTFAPFGTAFLATVPYKNMFISLIGTIFGYLLPSEINIGIRYISAAIAICAVRWALNDLYKVQQYKFYSSIISFFVAIVTGLATNFTDLYNFNNIFLYIIEAIFSGGAAYFFNKTFFILLNNKLNIKQTDFIYICTTVFIVILSLLNVKINSISIGKILSIFIILFCSKYVGLIGGTVSGIISGVIFGLSTKNPSYIIGSFSFGGLVTGLVSSFNKIICCMFFLMADLIITIQASNIDIIIVEIYEILFAGLIFIFLPDTIGNYFNQYFCIINTKNDNLNLKNSIITHLKLASEMLLGLSESISAISNKLYKINKLSDNNICINSFYKICSNCGLNKFCFNFKLNKDSNFFINLEKILNKNSRIDKKDFASDFINRCPRVDMLIKNINQSYIKLRERNISEKQIDNIKNSIFDQFNDTGNILYDIFNNIENNFVCDNELSQKVTNNLKKINIDPKNVICKYNKYNKLIIEIETNSNIKMYDNKLLLDLLSNLSKKSLKNISIIHIKNKYKIQIFEQNLYDVEIGISQHICKNGILCGDNFTYFYDENGKIIFILSDGMGTGGRAAVEGAMACKLMENLIKIGVSVKTAIKLTNSALLMKSNDEILATLDILILDLFTGDAEIIKAGAPFSVLKKCDKVEKLSADSLPIGILKEINIVNKKEILCKNDKIVMFSDGAISENDEILLNEVQNWNSTSPKKFVNETMKKIKENKDPDFDDDITLIAIKLVKNI